MMFRGMTDTALYKTVLLALILGILTACSSTRPYKSSSPENLTLKLDIRSGSAWMNVYEVDNACATKYLGTVALEGARVKVAIPVNKPSYLQFYFSNTSLLSSKSISYSIYLSARAGNQYDATVSYFDDMYNAVVFEQETHGGTRREITRNIPKACVSK